MSGPAGAQARLVKPDVAVARVIVERWLLRKLDWRVSSGASSVILEDSRGKVGRREAGDGRVRASSWRAGC
eukprot:317785-Chlamydomonas_euryale.AAC.2